jgi:hypothetical protein
VTDAPFVDHLHLFLEQRVQHDGGTSCVFETLDGIQPIPERGRTRNERVREAHAEV